MPPLYCHERIAKRQFTLRRGNLHTALRKAKRHVGVNGNKIYSPLQGKSVKRQRQYFKKAKSCLFVRFMVCNFGVEFQTLQERSCFVHFILSSPDTLFETASILPSKVRKQVQDKKVVTSTCKTELIHYLCTKFNLMISMQDVYGYKLVLVVKEKQEMADLIVRQLLTISQNDILMFRNRIWFIFQECRVLRY